MKEQRDRSDYVNVRVPREVWAALTPHAEADSRSTSGLVLSLLRDALETKFKKVKRPPGQARNGRA